MNMMTKKRATNKPRHAPNDHVYPRAQSDKTEPTENC